MTIQPSEITQWQPPADFQPVPSALAGITVYAPRPKPAEAESAVVYKCPKCGAAIPGVWSQEQALAFKPREKAAPATRGSS